MSSPISSHDGFIKNTLLSEFNIPLDKSTAERHKVGSNNHVYMVALAKSFNSNNGINTGTRKLKPFTQSIPNGISRLVFRIPRAESSFEDSICIRNEVSVLALARDALADVDPSLVRLVFGWHASAIEPQDARADASPIYIIEEFIGGDVLTGDDLMAFDAATRLPSLSSSRGSSRCFRALHSPRESFWLRCCHF